MSVHRSNLPAAPDVVVIGGGPAGSTVSTLMADQGLAVQLFERERFPRFHIGESLIPETYWVLARLGMLEKMKRSRFVKKYSFSFGQFVKRFPELSGTVTDLLIGDLFTERVDRVWGPMESMYPAGKRAPVAWNEGRAPDPAAPGDRENELFLPAGLRP